MSTSRSSSREKTKSSEFTTSLGFVPDRLLPPSCVNLNRFAFEIFLQNLSSPTDSQIFTSDLIEHAFQIIGLASEKAIIKKEKVIVDHIFVFAFYEILCIENIERAIIFSNRQSHFTSFSPNELAKLSKIDPNNTDSNSIIFDNLLCPIKCEFPIAFYSQLQSFIEKTSAPAVSFLLRRFIHNPPLFISDPIHSADSHSNGAILSTGSIQPTISNIPLSVWGTTDSFPQLFSETPFPKINLRSNPSVEFQMTHDIPTLVISRPRYIPPQLPSITCMHAPKYAEYSALCSSGPPVYVFTSRSNLWLVDIARTTITSLKAHFSPICSLALSETEYTPIILSGDVKGELKTQRVRYFYINSKEEKVYIDSNHSCNQKDNTSALQSEVFEHISYQSLGALVTAADFGQPRSKEFAVGTLTGVVAVYRIGTPRALRMFLQHKLGVAQVAMHANNEFVASSSMDGTIRLWQISAGQCVRLFKTAGTVPTALAWSHSGHYLLSGGYANYSEKSNEFINIIDVGTGQIVKTPKGCESGITLATFTKDDQMIVAVDRSNGLHIFEMKEGTSSHNGAIASVKLDKMRVIGLTTLDTDQIRIIGCI